MGKIFSNRDLLSSSGMQTAEAIAVLCAGVGGPQKPPLLITVVKRLHLALGFSFNNPVAFECPLHPD